MNGGDPSRPRVLSVVWNLIRGGTEGQCARVAMGLAGRGWTHRVAVFRREGFFVEAVERACGPLVPFEIQGRFRWSTLTRIRALAAGLRRERIDLLHAWDMDACLFGARAAAQAGIPYLTSRRDLAQIYPAWKLRGLARVESRAAGVVVNASAITPLALASGVPASRVHLLPNLLDVEEFDRLRGAATTIPSPTGGRVRIVQVARLDPEKDTATLLRAARRLAAERRDFEIVLAGDGVERAALADAARDMGDCVRFLGDVREIPALLGTCAIGVLVPKANEGLSNTLLEYMAVGLPMVATDCGGNRDLVVNGETGRLIPCGDAEALADALRHLLDHPDERARLGRLARRRVEERHGREAVLDRFETLYREAAHVRP